MTILNFLSLFWFYDLSMWTNNPLSHIILRSLFWIASSPLFFFFYLLTLILIWFFCSISFTTWRQSCIGCLGLSKPHPLAPISSIILQIKLAVSSLLKLVMEHVCKHWVVLHKLGLVHFNKVMKIQQWETTSWFWVLYHHHGN